MSRDSFGASREILPSPGDQGHRDLSQNFSLIRFWQEQKYLSQGQSGWWEARTDVLGGLRCFMKNSGAACAMTTGI